MKTILIGAACGWAGAVAITYVHSSQFLPTSRKVLAGAAAGALFAMLGSVAAKTALAAAAGAFAAELVPA